MKRIFKILGIILCLLAFNAAMNLLSYPNDLVVGIAVFALPLSMFGIILIALPTIKNIINKLKTKKNVHRKHKSTTITN